MPFIYTSITGMYTLDAFRIFFFFSHHPRRHIMKLSGEEKTSRAMNKMGRRERVCYIMSNLSQ